MTARILGRWARLLSRCPQASATATCLQLPSAQPAEPLWSHSRIRHAVRPLCQDLRKTQEQKSQVPFKRTELDVAVEKAATQQDVLQAWEDLGGSPNQAAVCLIQLSRLAAEKGGADPEGILQDPRFVDLLETVNSQVMIASLLKRSVNVWVV